MDVGEARLLLGLGERATLLEVKNAYRDLARQHHPDTGDEEGMEAINEAYNTIMDYIQGYEYCFSKKEQRKQDPEKAWLDGMRKDPVWGRE
mgnify:FL=1